MCSSPRKGYMSASWLLLHARTLDLSLFLFLVTNSSIFQLRTLLSDNQIITAVLQAQPLLIIYNTLCLCYRVPSTIPIIIPITTHQVHRTPYHKNACSIPRQNQAPVVYAIHVSIAYCLSSRRGWYVRWCGYYKSVGRKHRQTTTRGDDLLF